MITIRIFRKHKLTVSPNGGHYCKVCNCANRSIPEFCCGKSATQHWQEDQESKRLKRLQASIKQWKRMELFHKNETI